MKAAVHHFTLLLLIVSGAIVLSACAQATPPSPSLPPLTVQLTWTHSAQFAGFYAADQNGDYAAEGLVVSFIEGGSTVDRLAPVLNGQAQFGLAGGVQLIPARAEGKPLRAIATILRRDPLAFFALAESGITRPEDFVGKTLWLPPQARPYLQAMTTRVGVTPNQYTVIDNATFTSLYSGEVDVVIGFVTSQGVEAQRAGYKLNVIYPDVYGVHLTSDNIFAADDFIAANPDLVTSFLRATFKGWSYAVEHPNEAGALVVKYNPKADLSLETDQMLASLPFINTGEDYIGWMKPEVWAGMEQTLRAQGVLTSPVNVAEVYTMQFLEEIYQK
jgi:ABC-type nitrate/sulfonate/bicarbonate transport system substrate-binding protein